MQTTCACTSGPTTDVNSADTQFPAVVSILNAALGQLAVGVACLTDDNSAVSFCLRSHGTVDIPQAMSFGHGFCPVEPDEAFRAACEARGEQTSFGCSVIACVEALNALGLAGCTAAVAAPLTGLFTRAFVSNAVCALIHNRDHFYTVPGNGVPTTVCTTANGAQCNASFVTQQLLTDVRNQAPAVLQGPPQLDSPAPLLTQARPIQANATYFLGNPQITVLGLSTPNATSNPIIVSVPGNDPGCSAAATNTAKPDHPLVGTVSTCILQQGSAVRSLIYGRGTNTRFALLNELMGPWFLRGPQDNLRSTVLSALARTAPPPPPHPTCGRPPCQNGD